MSLSLLNSGNGNHGCNMGWVSPEGIIITAYGVGEVSISILIILTELKRDFCR